MTTLTVGKKVPDFKLSDKTGKSFSLAEISKGIKVLYFYPKDDTPGCTIEAKEFSDALPLFKKKNAVVVGISGGNDKTKLKFCEKYKLGHLLLSDPEFKTSKSFGTFGKKKFMGREYEGIFRRTFIVDDKNTLVKVFDDVSPKGHAAEVLEFLSSGTSAKPKMLTASTNKPATATKPRLSGAVKKSKSKATTKLVASSQKKARKK